MLFTSNHDRKIHNSDNDAQRTNDNLEDRIGKISLQIDDKYVYRISATYFCELGKINFPTKTDVKIRLTLETEMKKLFEWKKKVRTIGAPDIKIVFTKAPYLQYK